MPKALELTGQRFGKLVVLGREHHDPQGRLAKLWRCQCDCGNTEVLPAYRLPRLASLRSRPSVTVTACEDCRGKRICAACGRGFSTAAANSCCSYRCFRVHKRRIEQDCRDRTAERQRAEPAP